MKLAIPEAIWRGRNVRSGDGKSGEGFSEKGRAGRGREVRERPTTLSWTRYPMRKPPTRSSRRGQRKKVAIVSSGGRVNIRCGNGERYGRITQASAGQRFPYVATAPNGWHALEIAGKVGWVSGAFSRVV